MLQVSANEGYKTMLLFGMDVNLKESTYSVLDEGYAILRPKFRNDTLDIQDQRGS